MTVVHTQMTNMVSKCNKQNDTVVTPCMQSAPVTK